MVAAATVTRPETILVAGTTPPVPALVPVPATATERFVFAQLYETLINVDCDHHVYPGLARSWTLDETRTRVTLVLRDGAQFWNGKPVVASDVLAAWRATGGQSTEPSRLARRIADATTIVDDHTLTVSLPDTAWLVLAEPALAVYQPQAGPSWPEGTTRYRVAEQGLDHEPGGLLLAPIWPSAAPHLGIRSRRTSDPRDAIDRGADVLVTDDPLAISYSATHSELAAVPLPWSRAYVLAIPRFGPADADMLRPILGDSAAAFRASLARDAVRAEARAAEPPYWWNDTRSCPMSEPSAVPKRGSQQRPMRVVYDASDRVAGQLAERLIALQDRAVAAPLATEAFARALHDGSEPAYVIGLSRTPLDICYEAAKLVAAAPWILPASGSATPAAPVKMIPLVDTRARAIVNRDRVSAAIDWDGTLRFDGPGAP